MIADSVKELQREATPPRVAEWIKVVLGGSVAVALLVAYGFLSEIAAYQYLGLPQLQADAIEMAEQGGRNLVDGLAAIGWQRAMLLVLLAIAVAVLWWHRRHPRVAVWLFSPRLLKLVQLIAIVALTILAATFVEVRGLANPSGLDSQAQRERAIRAEERERGGDWNPRQEFARVEAQSFEVGLVRLFCEHFPDVDWLCFTHEDYRSRESRRQSTPKAADHARDAEDQLPPSASGLSRRKTQAARAAARETFRDLFTALLLGGCLVQAPQSLPAAFRETLRGLALGRWQPVPSGAEGQQATAAPPARADKVAVPFRIRRIALGELYEAGLFFEASLLSELLHDSDPQMRSEAAKFLEDVEAPAMREHLWTCATHASASDTEDRALRCLRALPLLAVGEDGDGDLTPKLLAAMPDADDTRQEALCVALQEFAARGGRDALVALRADERSPGEAVKHCEDWTAAHQDVLSNWDHQERRFLHLRAFSDRDAMGAIADTRSQSQATPVQPSQDRSDGADADRLAALRRASAEGALDDRIVAFLLLSQESFAAAGAVAVERFLERPATLLSFFAGTVLEDAPVSDYAPLLECATAAQTEPPLRQRCLIGLALTAADYQPSAEDLKRLSARPEGADTAAWCRLLQELQRRGAEVDLKACPSGSAPLPEDPRARWKEHLEALRLALHADRTDHGKWPGETDELHAKQLKALSEE